jgi:hypothetical protein
MRVANARSLTLLPYSIFKTQLKLQGLRLSSCVRAELLKYHVRIASEAEHDRYQPRRSSDTGPEAKTGPLRRLAPLAGDHSEAIDYRSARLGYSMAQAG